MTSINRVVEIGRLTQDAKLEYTPGGMAISKFSIAVNHSTKKADGTWADDAYFFDVFAFGKIAENLKPYLLKGKMVGIDGYLKQERWQDKETGSNRAKVTIVANDIQLLGDKNNNSSSEQSDYGYGE